MLKEPINKSFKCPRCGRVITKNILNHVITTLPSERNIIGELDHIVEHFEDCICGYDCQIRGSIFEYPINHYNGNNVRMS